MHKKMEVRKSVALSDSFNNIRLGYAFARYYRDQYYEIEGLD